MVFAIAYLDAATTITRELVAAGKATDFVRGSPATYLARHSVELFLKGALLKADVEVKNIHSLENLASRYEEKYQGSEYAWNIPFRTQVVGADGKDAEKIVRNHNKAQPGDQIPRYPADKAFKPWAGVRAFDAQRFIETLGTIRSDFDRLMEVVSAR